MSKEIPNDVIIGVIGGSGVYHMDFVANPTYYDISTPFGNPSDQYIVTSVDGIKCAFLPRHGRNHTLLPTEINYRANIFGFKKLGCKYLFTVSACGSLRDDFNPKDLVVFDQIIDRVGGLHHNLGPESGTFFGRGIVAHVAYGHPVCANMHKIVVDTLRGCFIENKDLVVHGAGTIVTMAGPAFSTKAESLMNRQLGGDLIGMTTAPEARLAREAELAYSSVAMVTDVDSWKDDENHHVDVAKVMEVMKTNSMNAQIFIKAVIIAIGKAMPSSFAHSALAVAIVMKKEHVPPKVLKEMQPIIGKYMPLTDSITSEKKKTNTAVKRNREKNN